MPTIEAEIRSELLGDAGVTAIVGDSGVHWQRAPRTSSLPFVVLSRPRTEVHQHQTGRSNADQFDLDCSCYAASTLAAAALGDAVSSVIAAFDATMQSTPRVRVRLQDVADRVDAPLDAGSDDDVHVRVLTFTVWHPLS